MASSVTNTIQGTLAWAAAFILNRTSSGVAGNYQEPGLTIANLLMSTILAPPFAWHWNRNTTTITAVAGTSDYTKALTDFGWLETATVFLSGATPETVAIEVSPFFAAESKTGRPFKLCVANDDNAGSYIFRLMPAPDAAYTINLSYQKAPIKATTLFGASVGSITSIAAASGGSTIYTASGGFTGGTANGLAGQYVIISSATTAANNGIFYVTASTATTITVNNQNGILQAGAAGTAQLGTTWAPIPDKYNFLYERGVKAHLHAMYDMATYLAEIQLFFRQLVGVSEGLSDTAKAIFLEDRLSQIRTEAASAAATTASPKRGQ